MENIDMQLENLRLAELRSYALLDTPAQQTFDDITLMAAQICNLPIALISLVDEKRQWFKSKVGLDADETPREHAFCAHAIKKPDELFIVPDAEADERFRDNPLVTGTPNVRFYAGAPLVTKNGFALGTLCVIDTIPRELNVQQLKALDALKRNVITAFELRKAMRDIKDTETALKESLARQNAIFNNAADAIITIDANGIIDSFNPKAVSLFKITAEDAVGLNISEFMPPEHGSKHNQYLKNYIESKESKVIGKCNELTCKNYDGSLFIAELSVGEFDVNGKKMFTGIIIDITERKEIENNLKYREERYRKIFELSPEVIVLFDDKGFILDLNDRCFDFTGYTKQELLNLHLSQVPFFDKKSKETVMYNFSNRLSNISIPPYETEYIHKNGTICTGLISAALIKNENEQNLQIFAMISDITVRKNNEKLIKQSNDMMKAINSLMGLYISESLQESELFDILLVKLLEISCSEYGFISKVLYDVDAQPYFKTISITDLSWNEEVRKLYDLYSNKDLEFRNLNTLFGNVLKTKKTVISNNPANDSRSGGLPENHPPLNAFIGIPIMKNDDIIGLYGLANRAGGYDWETADYLEPFTSTLGYILLGLDEKDKRKKAEEALRINQRAIDSSSNGIVIVDAKDTHLPVIYVNKGFEKITGYKSYDIIGKNCNILQGTDNDQPGIIEIRNAIKNNKHVTTVLRNYKKDGTLFWNELTISPIFDENKDITHFVGLQNDITERKTSQEKLEAAYRTIKNDFYAAAQIQRDLLPNVKYVIPGLSFKWLFIPSVEVSGDIFNYFQLDENITAFYLLDVSGHGIPAAMMSVTLSRMISPYQKPESLLRILNPVTNKYIITPPAEVISHLNSIYQSELDSISYFTMIYGVIDFGKNKITFCQAGHPSPMLLTSGGEVKSVGTSGFPVGMLPDMNYENQEFDFIKGDKLFIYSDGVTECSNNQGILFSEELFIKTISENRNKQMEEIIENLKINLKNWKSGDDFEDDITILAIERTYDV